MKFLHAELSKVFEWDENYLPTLIIENKKLFNEIIIDLLEQTEEGYEGKTFILDEKDRNIIKETKLIIEPYSLTLANKEISAYVSKFLISRVKETNIDIEEKLKPLYTFVQSTFLELPLEIEIEKTINQTHLTKVFPYKIYDDSNTILEKIVNYTRTMMEFNLKKMFIFVNLKQYLDESEYAGFANFVRMEKINVLLIEQNKSYSRGEEKYYIVDKDFCII